MGNFGRSSEENERMPMGMHVVKAGLMRVQMEMRILLGTGPEVIHVTSWQRTCLHFVHALRLSEGEFKMIDYVI